MNSLFMVSFWYKKYEKNVVIGETWKRIWKKLKNLQKNAELRSICLWFSARTLFFYRIIWSKKYVEN